MTSRRLGKSSSKTSFIFVSFLILDDAFGLECGSGLLFDNADE